MDSLYIATIYKLVCILKPFIYTLKATYMYMYAVHNVGPAHSKYRLHNEYEIYFDREFAWTILYIHVHCMYW